MLPCLELGFIVAILFIAIATERQAVAARDTDDRVEVEMEASATAAAESPSADEILPVLVISVGGDGVPAYVLDGAIVTSSALSDRIGDVGSSLEVRVDDDAPYKQLQPVLAMCAQHGVTPVLAGPSP